MSEEGGATVATEQARPGRDRPEREHPEQAQPEATGEGPPAFVRPAPPKDMFVPLEEQLANVRRWNDERSWGFRPEVFDAIDLTPKGHDDPLVAEVIAVFLPGDEDLDPVRRTCDELWAVISDQHPNSWCWDEKCWDLSKVGRKQVRLLHRLAHVPGVRRVTLDLGAHWNPVHPTRSIDVRGTDSAHAEVLSAAAHFPNWVRAMDGLAVPYALLSGYQVTLVEAESWRRLPCLSWNESRRTVSLTAHWADIFAPSWSSPVCLAAPDRPAPDRPAPDVLAPNVLAPGVPAPDALAPDEPGPPGTIVWAPMPPVSIPRPPA